MPGLAEQLPDRAALVAWQREQRQALLAEILPRNPFYARKFAGFNPEDFAGLPFTTKAELIENQQAHPPYGDILTYPPDRYLRLHQTSGTSGRPLRWLDTVESWNRMLGTWEQMFHLIGLRPGDRLFFAFSFGPFISFWTAFESALRLGYQCLASGGMSSGARLRYLLDNAATLVLCTPTYALRLAEIARKEDINLAESPVRGLIVGGETGGSIPATRALIEKAWAARVFDHSGMTETGPVGQECHANPFGLHLVETDFLAEVIDPETGRAVPPGQDGELVLTTLGRWGSPLVRYRTGDLVRIDPQPCRCGSPFLRLDGGILGRIDDLIHVRGVNVYPSALEEVLRRFPDVIEFRLEITQQAEMPTLRLEVEPATAEGAGDLVRRLAQTIRDELFFRPEIRAVAPGTLPRYEMKARRVIKKN